jgi:hypothetical protein
MWRKPEERILVLLLACSLPGELQCCGVVQRQPAVADAMIEATVPDKVHRLCFMPT